MILIGPVLEMNARAIIWTQVMAIGDRLVVPIWRAKHRAVSFSWTRGNVDGYPGEIVAKLQGIAAAFNAHDIDSVMSFFAPDCSLDMPRGTEPHGTRFQGKDQVRKGLQSRLIHA